MTFASDDPIQTTEWDSPLGRLLLTRQGHDLLGVWFSDQANIPTWASDAPRVPADGVLAEAVRQLGRYFAGRQTSFDLPLRLHGGTPFQQSVWRALQAIPYGQTTSYAAVAQSIGRPGAMRATGSAIGRNPLGIVIPCHRVVGRQGALTGYTGGLERKRALLALEARHA